MSWSAQAQLQLVFKATYRWCRLKSKERQFHILVIWEKDMLGFLNTAFSSLLHPQF